MHLSRVCECTFQDLLCRRGESIQTESRSVAAQKTEE